MFVREGRQKGEVMKRHLDEGGWCQWDVSWCTDVAQKASIERGFYCTSRPGQELLLSQKRVIFVFCSEMLTVCGCLSRRWRVAVEHAHSGD